MLYLHFNALNSISIHFHKTVAICDCIQLYNSIVHYWNLEMTP